MGREIGWHLVRLRRVFVLGLFLKVISVLLPLYSGILINTHRIAFDVILATLRKH